MKKAIVTIHLWLGLSSGLVVCILGITGCIYVFEDELKLFFYRDKIYIDVPANGSKKPLSELRRIAQEAVGKDHPIQQIQIPAEENRSYLFRPALKRNPKVFTYFGEYEYYRMLYINPYTGMVIKNENAKYEFFNIVLGLHRNLLLNRNIGHYIVGTSVLLFVILLVTGLVLWWPKNIAAIKQRVSFIWKKNTKWKRKNYDLHNVLGFYSFFFALIIALTGLTWSFDWFSDSVQWLANGGANKKSKPVFSDTTQVSDIVLPIDRLFYDLAKQNPDAKLFAINIPTDKKAVLNISVYVNEQLSYNRKQFQYDQYSGKLLRSTAFEDKNTGEKLKSMNYDIHVGRILSLPGKLLAFFIGLIVASLPITGFYVWYGKRVKEKTTKKQLIQEKQFEITGNMQLSELSANK